MVNDLTKDQKMLHDFMSELSELAFHAGWMHDLEHALWRAVVDGPFRYGHLDITAEQIGRLKTLSSACGSWIVFDEVLEELAMPLEDWGDIYDATCVRYL
jgi:hypothetical protein